MQRKQRAQQGTIEGIELAFLPGLVYAQSLLANQANILTSEIERIRGGAGIKAGAKKQKPLKKKHRISAEGRARIAAAQRKRWAAKPRGKASAAAASPR